MKQESLPSRERGEANQKKPEGKLSPEEVELFKDIDGLLVTGQWKFLGNFFGKDGVFEILLEHKNELDAAGKPRALRFKSASPYNRIVFADGKTKPSLESENPPPSQIPSPS